MRTFAFDLDGTLAPSKSPLPDAMVAALSELLAHDRVAVISGGAWPQFEAQVISRLETAKAHWDRLHLLPTCGTHYRRWNGQEWEVVYDHPLPLEVRRDLIAELENQAKLLGLWCEDSWGPIIEDRGSQITYSALGQEAPLAEKEAWDPDGTKKLLLRDKIATLFPELDVKAGGSTSVDITAKGVDKAYGLRQLMEALDTDRAHVIFIGDRLDPNGNDYSALTTGVACHWIKDWRDCLALLAEYAA